MEKKRLYKTEGNDKKVCGVCGGIAEYFDVSVEKLIYGKEKPRWHFAVNYHPEKVIELGMIIAAVISYVEWGSVGWAILHGLLNWAYVLYYIIRY